MIDLIFVAVLFALAAGAILFVSAKAIFEDRLDSIRLSYLIVSVIFTAVFIAVSVDTPVLCIPALVYAELMIINILVIDKYRYAKRFEKEPEEDLDDDFLWMP